MITSTTSHVKTPLRGVVGVALITCALSMLPRYPPGLRIGLAKYDEGDAWASAEKAATRHFRKIHRGEPRIIVREWVDELGCDAWVVRKAVQSETNT